MRTTLALLALLVATILPAAAQETARPPFLGLYEDAIHLDRAAGYEAALVSLRGVLETAAFQRGYTVYGMDNLGYQVHWELRGLADVERDQEALGAAIATLPAADLARIFTPHDEAILSQGFSLLRYRAALSYPTPAGTVRDFVHQTWLYVRRDRLVQAREVLSRIAARHAETQAPMRFEVYERELGADMPLIVVVSGAESAAAYEALAEANAAKLGDPGYALLIELQATLRRYEERRGWARPDLSFQPAP